MRWAVTPWLRQRAQVGERLTTLRGISSMPCGTLVSLLVAESEGKWWTAGISLGSMDLEAGVEGQNGHVGPLLTTLPAPGRPHLRWFSIPPTSGLSFHLCFFTPLPSSGILLPSAPSSQEPLSSFFSYSFNPNILPFCSPVTSHAEIPVLVTRMHSHARCEESYNSPSFCWHPLQQ